VALRPPSHKSLNINLDVVYSKFQFYVYLLFIKLSAHRLPLSKIKRHRLNEARFKKLSEKRAAAAASSMELFYRALIAQGFQMNKTLNPIMPQQFHQPD